MPAITFPQSVRELSRFVSNARDPDEIVRSLPASGIVVLLCDASAVRAADSNDIPRNKIEGYIVSDTVILPSMNGMAIAWSYNGDEFRAE